MGEPSEEKKPQVFDISSLDTYELLALFVSILSAQAWQHLGLRVKPGTDKIQGDLERANTAIDCISFMVEKLKPRLTEEESKRLSSVTADLKMNFARVKLKKCVFSISGLSATKVNDVP